MNFKTTFKRTMAVLICFMLILTSFQFVASADAALSTNKTEYEVGEDILVTATGSGDQWVGLYLANDIVGDPNSVTGAVGSYYWYYVAKEGHNSGETYVIQNGTTNNRGVMYPGDYKVCLFADGGYTVVETVYLTITGEVDITSKFSTDKTEYVEGEKIYVTATGSRKDWIGIYENGLKASGSVNSIYWYYVADYYDTSFAIQGGTGGRNNHDYSASNYYGLPAGKYDLIYFSDDSYIELERQTITIKKAVHENLSTDKPEYIEGEDVFVTASGEFGQKVGIFKEDDTDDALPIYEFEITDSTNGIAFNIKSGNLNREDEKDLLSGNYKVVLFGLDSKVKETVYITVSKKPFDEILPDSENVAQTSKNGMLKTDKTQYKMGEPIMVTATVSQEVADNKAWVGIVPQGITVTAGGAVTSYWYYVNDERYGAKNGEAFDIFKGDSSNSQYTASYYPIKDGYYDIVLYAADGYEVLDKITISRYTPSDIPTELTMDKAIYTEGDPIYITATSPEAKAWVGIYEKDIIPAEELAVHWYWVESANGIPLDLINSVVAAGKSLPAGEWKAVLFNDDGYGNIAQTVYFTIEPLDTSNTTFDFTVNGKEFESGKRFEIIKGEKVLVKPLVEGDAIGFSWIGIYNGAYFGQDADFKATPSDNWKYVTEFNGEDWDITDSLATGPNTVVLFSNGGYTVVKYAWIYIEREDVLSKEVVVEATCTDMGIIHYVYKDGTEEDVFVMALGHSPVKSDEVVEATPDQIGGVKGTCERCGEEMLLDQVKFDIKNADINVTTIIGEEMPLVTVEYKGKRLVEDTHYAVTVSETEDGKVATIVGINNCSGMVQKPFSVSKYDLSTATVTVEDVTYTGKELTPAVEVVFDGKLLVQGNDYELEYSDNINVGLGKVTVKGKGNYSGSVVKTFEIKAVTPQVILSKESFVYTGKVQKPTVKVSVNGKELTRNNYTVKYATGCKKVGEYSVTVTINGAYESVVTETFVIVPKATKLNKLVAGKKSLTVKWAKKTVEVGGYEIQYSTSKNFKNSKIVKIKKAKSAQKAIKKLKAKKKYFVRIRTFKKAGKATFVSAWSKAKSVKTK